MKRKLFCIFLFVLFGVSIFIPASADLLWEPFENDYYRTHMDSLQYMDRTYVVPNGLTANLYESPVQGGLIKTLPAGSRIYIGPYGEINGELWAIGQPYDDWQTSGWMRLNRLQKEYGHEDFYAQFEDTFIATDDQLTQQDIETEIQTWTYPGSGISDGVLPKEVLGTDYNDGVMDFRFVYTDPAGGRWGYVGYFMGQCGWVYLDDPETAEPPMFPQTGDDTGIDTSPETDPKPSIPSFLLPILLVIVVAAMTGVIILKLKHKKR